jgi:hypothetical protein
MKVFPSLLLAFIAALVAPTVAALEPNGRAPSIRIVSHIRRQQVDSTAIASIGYSKRMHALEIEFVNGAIYRYLGVPPSLYRKLMAVESKARFYDKNVRGHYRSIHVKPRKSR